MGHTDRDIKDASVYVLRSLQTHGGYAISTPTPPPTHEQRQPPDKLRNQPVVHQVLGLGHFKLRPLLLTRGQPGPFQRGAEADGGPADAALDQLLHARKGAPTDEEHVARVDLQHVAARVLAPPALGHVHQAALQQLQQRLRGHKRKGVREGEGSERNQGDMEYLRLYAQL